MSLRFRSLQGKRDSIIARDQIRILRRAVFTTAIIVLVAEILRLDVWAANNNGVTNAKTPPVQGPTKAVVVKPAPLSKAELLRRQALWQEYWRRQQLQRTQGGQSVTNGRPVTISRMPQEVAYRRAAAIARRKVRPRSRLPAASAPAATGPAASTGPE
jgi:hypothetical protein